MTSDHTHKHTDELVVFHIPADERKPMGVQIISHRLSSLQRLVGGYIEIVRTDMMPRLRCGCSTTLVVNEEGAIREMAHNPRANRLYPEPGRIFGDTFLVGEGLVETDGFPERDMVSLPQEFSRWSGPQSPVPRPNKITRLAEKGQKR